jgi:uncharacterized protein YpuA (DUF1002 family)
LVLVTVNAVVAALAPVVMLATIAVGVIVTIVPDTSELVKAKVAPGWKPDPTMVTGTFVAFWPTPV